MATIYYSGNQIRRPRSYTVTVTGVSVGGTLTATCNSKSVVYTAITGDTTSTVASGMVSALNSTLINEFRDATYTSSGAVITAVGPDDGMPLTITWSGGGGVTISSSTVTPLSPSDIADTANYVGGALPTGGDTLVVENTSVGLLYNLNQFNATAVILVRRYSHTGSIGLADISPNGYVQYRPTHFKTTATSHTLEDNQIGFVRLHSTATNATTVTIAGQNPGSVGSEYIEVVGLPSGKSNVININGGTLAIAPLQSQTCEVSTLRVANAALRTGVNATTTTVTIDNTQSQIGGPYTTFTADGGSQVSFVAASDGTTTNILNGSIQWMSTGSPGDIVIGSNGVFDMTTTPNPVTVDSVQIYGAGQFMDPYKRATRPFTITGTSTRLEDVTMEVGTGFVIDVN